MAASQALPEPMNSQPHHSKVKITVTLPDPTFVAGAHVSGKLEMECRADRGLGIGIMMVELFAIQELSSRDHSATSTFLHSRRLFQGPGLPPSNAVQAHPMPGDPPLPQHYHQARKGRSTFLFRIPIPASSPSSITFGSGLAKVTYELRASVGVYWKNEKRLVIDKAQVDVVEAFPFDDIFMGKIPEAIVVGENGKLWMQGKIVGNVILAGDSACLELQVKNHSNKKNSGLTLSLIRTLYLPSSTVGRRQAPVQISDTLTTVPFRGSEYIIPPGAEGVANLVFDVPKIARGVRGGTLDGEEAEDGSGPRHTESLFEVKCKVEVKLTMGMGSKDIVLEIPVEIVHPSALPSQTPMPGPYAQPYPVSQEPFPISNPTPYTAEYNPNPYYPIHPMSPAPQIPYVDPVQNQVWMPPPQAPPIIPPPIGYPYYPPHLPISVPALLPEGYHSHYPDPVDPQHQAYLGTQQTHYLSPQPHPQDNLFVPDVIPHIPRPSSVGAVVTASQVPQPSISGLPPPPAGTSLIPLHALHGHPVSPPRAAGAAARVPSGSPETRGRVAKNTFDTELGKGDRALRVSQHLRISSRNRSVSPQSHRYPHPHPGVLSSVDEASNFNDLGPTSHAHAHGAAVGPPSGQQQQQQRYPRSLPPPPPLLLKSNSNTGPALSSPLSADGMVHSPRPQLTPKHSFTHEPVLVSLPSNGNGKAGPAGIGGGGVMMMTITKSKSERVEELEKMAEEVAKKSVDLSQDLPKGAGDVVVVSKKEEEKQSRLKPNTPTQADPSSGEREGAVDVNINKTLPGPPVPSGKNLLPLPGRARADLYFAEHNNEVIQETTPLPSDQTPPTPALLAVHPSRSYLRQQQQNRKDLRTESGLDALEKRLLAEVGTRKMDSHRYGHGLAKDKAKDKDKRPDVRDVLSVSAGVEQEDGAGSSANQTRTRTSSVSMSIPATTKSPETLHDSAISSLTLAGGAGGDESDVDPEPEVEFDGRTHRAGKSRAGSNGDDEDDEREGRTSGGGNGGGGGLLVHMSMRERAQAVSTPTRTLNLEWVLSGGGSGQRDQDSREDLDSGKSREGKSTGAGSGKKKDRSSKSAAKGRVAAWLGRIDPDIPPQEQIIPPSPSVSQTPASPFSVGRDIATEPPEGLPLFTTAAATEEGEPPTQILAPPNPRSSGFVPIATLKKETLPNRPLIAKDATVMEEARRVQDIWASANENENTPMISAQGMPRFFKALQPAAPGSMSIHTNRRVSPPSSSASTKPPPPDPKPKPLSYSAVTKSVWKSPPETVVNAKPVVVPPVPPPKTPVSPVPRRAMQTSPQSGGVGRVNAAFPPSRSIDPEVKYDIRSARGGRGGKVTAVANLWASGAISNQVLDEQAKGKGVSRPVDSNVSVAPTQSQSQSQSQPPPLPPRAGKKLFSDAVLTPALPPKRTSAATSNVAANVNPNANAISRPTDAQKRPDARTAFSDPNLKSTSSSTTAADSRPAVGANAVNFVPKKVQTATPLVPPRSQPPMSKFGAGVGVSKGSKSTEALELQKRPSTSMSSSSRPNGKTTPTSLSTPSTSQAAVADHHTPIPKLHNLVANLKLKGVTNNNMNMNNVNSNHHKPTPKRKPPVMYKGMSDPAVVSSSHAIPMLSSTASLARPHNSSSAPVSAPAVPSSSSSAQKNNLALASNFPLNMNNRNLVPKVSSGLGHGLLHGLSVNTDKDKSAKDVGIGGGVGVSGGGQARPASPSKPVVDLAIGQARIRDLIKKYQGGPRT